MEKEAQQVDTATLQSWLENNKNVLVVDVRPPAQREEWQIPGSIYVNAYERLNKGDESVLDDVKVPENTKVVTVCAMGRTSQLAANVLRKKGIDAYSLQDGMKGWSMAWNLAETSFRDFSILQIRRTGKGCLSYIVSSNNEAIIIDASLPADMYAALIEEKGLTVKFVLETHIHADHLSRAKALSELFNAPLFLPVPNKVQYPFNEVKADATFTIGKVTLRALPTPGHTLESISYYIDNTALFTGDTIFTAGVGRPDLKASAEESREKATLLYQSLQKILSLPGEVMILPAHTSQPIPFDGQIIATTIGEIKKRSSLLQTSESFFVDTLLEKIPETPPNYLSIVESNLTGEFSENNAADLEAGANRCAIS
jgi:glyoxylase-like metal-dependent hydrolase (beta-lactamase superfamily II)/rhodanese-related sulfurtransferase